MEFHLRRAGGQPKIFEESDAPHRGTPSEILPSQSSNPTFVVWRAALPVLLVCVSAWALPASESRAQNRDALRQIVQERCVPHWLQQGDPEPCERVSFTGARATEGYAVLADAKGGAHFLLIPTERVAGIESPELLGPRAPNYFAAAWKARDRIAAVLGHDVRRAAVGLAVNSEQHRSQDQLHIHMECLGEEVYRVVRTAGERLTDRWTAVRLRQWQYQGMRVMGEDLEQANPFELLAQRMPGARADMGAYTLLVAGMQFKEGPGFILLTGRNVPGAESLLDSTCAIANR
jgi:CDP-diacylglycerol pyrophosphatase